FRLREGQLREPRFLLLGRGQQHGEVGAVVRARGRAFLHRGRRYGRAQQGGRLRIHGGADPVADQRIDILTDGGVTPGHHQGRQQGAEQASGWHGGGTPWTDRTGPGAGVEGNRGPRPDVPTTEPSASPSPALALPPGPVRGRAGSRGGLYESAYSSGN